MLVAQPCPTCCDPRDLWPTRFLCPWNSLGKNTGVDCHCLLQGIFLNQGSNLGLLHCRQILYCLCLLGSPYTHRVQIFAETILKVKERMKTVCAVINALKSIPVGSGFRPKGGHPPGPTRYFRAILALLFPQGAAAGLFVSQQQAKGDFSDNLLRRLAAGPSRRQAGKRGTCPGPSWGLWQACWGCKPRLMESWWLPGGGGSCSPVLSPPAWADGPNRLLRQGPKSQSLTPFHHAAHLWFIASAEGLKGLRFKLLGSQGKRKGLLLRKHF